MFIQNIKQSQWAAIIVDVFQVSLIVYLLILLIEQFKAGFASNFINLNWILWVVIVSGIITVLLNNGEQEREKKEIKWWDYLFIAVFGLVSGVLIYLKIKDLNWIAWVIGILSCLMIWLISYLIINEEE